jgi:tRNA(Ile)-lysidine synthase
MGRGLELYRRWRHEVREQGFFRAGERVGVAVSGGPDSILLLDFMAEFAPGAGLTLAAAHFNHHLRGKESDEDERFVARRAKELGVDFLRGEADVAGAAEKRGNMEAAARELRYRYFFSLLDQGRLDKLATAHTANDQAETVLLKLLRGTGTRGLAGIYPVLEGKIVRPFLSLTRREIMGEIERRKLAHREDRTNLLPTLRRNKIRLELIPWLEKEFNPEIVPLLAELAERSREDEEVLEQVARERARPWRVHDAGEEKIPARALTELPPALARRVLRQMIQAASGGLQGVTHRHLEALERLTDTGQSGRQVLLPRRGLARREFDWLVIAPGRRDSAPSSFTYSVQAPGVVSVDVLDTKFLFKIIELGPSDEAYNASGKVGLDLDKISGKLVLRNWREGDRFQPHGSGKPRKLKEFFRERRIPAGSRAMWPLVECPRGIVWVRGFEPAAAVAAGPEARRILVVEEKPG